MKNAKKLISLIIVLALMLTVFPFVGMAAETELDEAMLLAEADPDSISVKEVLGQLYAVVDGIKIPVYAVYCKLDIVIKDIALPASYAQVTLTNQVDGKTLTYTANSLGLALIPKSLVGIYSVAATCEGMFTGIKFSTPIAHFWTASVKPDFDTLVLYPVLNIGLNYTDHYSYMVGYNDGTVRPDAYITRAEAASLIFRLMTQNARDRYYTTDNSFSDVAATNPHKNAINSLAKAGIICGYEDGTFHPNQTITREQFAAIIGRMFSVEYTGTTYFKDLSGNYADKYINLLYTLGIMKGVGNGNANPTGVVTRAQAAAMLNRLLGRFPADSSADSCLNTVKTWPDCPKGMWCYADILEATNSHYYTWATDAGNVANDDTVFCEQWTSLRTDTPDWIALSK